MEIRKDNPVLLEVYKAWRNHELVLNRARATFEHAVLSPLYLLNGGAAAAFLTLLGAASSGDSRLNVSTGWAAGAAFAWTVGLLFATFATYSGYRAQRGFSKGVRLQREQIEESLFATERSAGAKLPAPAKSTEYEGKVARVWQKRYISGIVSSGCSFAVGAAAAASSILL
jgi:hypothetical protein